MNPDFVDLLRAFVAAEIRFLVVGAYALGLHGRPRNRGPGPIACASLLVMLTWISSDAPRSSLTSARRADQRISATSTGWTNGELDHYRDSSAFFHFAMSALRSSNTPRK